jgi:hypothetical protein
MVNVTDGADVAVRLRPLEFSLRHCLKPSFRLKVISVGAAPARIRPEIQAPPLA